MLSNSNVTLAEGYTVIGISGFSLDNNNAFRIIKAVAKIVVN